MYVYTAQAIRRWDCDAGLPDGRHVPARPLGWGGWYGAWHRMRAAWGVLTGRFDALDWQDR